MPVPQVVGNASAAITALSSHKRSSAHYHLLLQNPVTPESCRAPLEPTSPAAGGARCVGFVSWRSLVLRRRSGLRWGPRVCRSQLALLPADKHFFFPSSESLQRERNWNQFGLLKTNKTKMGRRKTLRVFVINLAQCKYCMFSATFFRGGRTGMTRFPGSSADAGF